VRPCTEAQALEREGNAFSKQKSFKWRSNIEAQASSKQIPHRLRSKKSQAEPNEENKKIAPPRKIGGEQPS
jgi:hypothetical protein